MTRRRRNLILAGVIVIGLGLTPPVRTRITAAAALMEGLGMSVPRPFAPEVTKAQSEVDGVEGVLYDSGADRSILLVPGATPDGVDDARVNQVAEGLARSGRNVFIPVLDLYGADFTFEDLDRLTRVMVGLSQSSGRPVTVLGISYGGSFAMIAAADPRVGDHVSRIATFGAYYDLEGVIQAVSTGSSEVDGQVYVWDGVPIAEDILSSRAAEFLGPGDKEAFEAVWEGTSDPGTLPPDAAALYRLMVNEDPRLTSGMIDMLPPAMQSFIDSFSPAAVAHRIDAPLMAMHSTDDPAVPYAELVRLEEALPGVTTLTVELFRHVDFEPSQVWSLAPDLMRVWRFTSWTLSG